MLVTKNLLETLYFTLPSPIRWIDPAGYWWASAPQEEWPEDATEIAKIESEFVVPHGDRRQELVFIGNAMDEFRVHEILESCLVTDLEFVQGPGFWEQLADPFPEISLEDEEELQADQ